jgi:hypothetical protein
LPPLYNIYQKERQGRKMRRLLFFLILGISLNINTFAFAEISLDSYRQRLDILPGGISKGSIVVRNFSNQDITVKAEAEDFLYIAPFNGNKEFSPAGQNPYACSQWITISPAEFDLPALGTRTVAYEIKVPPDVKGGYHSVIFFERVQKEARVGTGILLRIGCTLLLETKGSIKDLKVRDVSPDKDAITGEFFNSCNLALISKPAFRIIDKKGAVLDKGELKEFYFPPEEKVPFKIKIASKIPQGDYTIEINFAFFGRGALIKEIGFSKDEAGALKIIKVEE